MLNDFEKNRLVRFAKNLGSALNPLVIVDRCQKQLGVLPGSSLAKRLYANQHKMRCFRLPVVVHTLFC
jgi:hypothetical protein